MLGTIVSHYKILEKIGEGGMGEVYLAEDTKLKRRVTLKFLSEELTRDKERKQRFIQEARAAAAVEHPHIAAIYDVDEVDGRTFIAMEYVRGESLRDAVQGQKLSLRKSLELATQIADGLSTAHERGVIHRDLKPENVLVSEQGYAKIIDFGLAKLVEPLFGSHEDSEAPTQLKTREGTIMGTVAYMSPEQARGMDVDARSDIFSFGVLLSEMISGRSPFRKATVVDTLSAILKEPAPSVRLEGAEIPEGLDRLLAKTLQKDPDQRYQAMKDVAHDLRELREAMTSTARPAADSGAHSASRWVGAAVIALVGLASGWFFFGRNVGPPGIGASGRPSVAVMYFESMSGDEEIQWLSRGLPNMLVTDLAQTPGLDVVSSQRIHEILQQVGQENLETIDKSVVTEVARRAGAGAAVVGSIFKSGDEIRIDVQVQDVGTGRVLSAESVRGNDVFPLVDELTGRIRASLEVGDFGSGRPIAEVTTPSLEAWELYTEGYQAMQNVRYADARAAFEKAVEIDPSFAMAYMQLSGLAQTRGEIALAREYMDLAYQNRDRLSERQDLLVRSQHAFFQDDWEQAAEIAATVVERYPDEELAYLSLSVFYLVLQRQDEAIAVIERGMVELPQSGPMQNMYGYLLLDKGRYPEAIRALENYARLDPDEPNPLDSLGEAYLISGQPDKALANYEKALELDPAFHVSRIGRTYSFGVLGRYDDFFSEVAKLIELSDRVGFPPAAFYFMRSLGLSRVGRYREAEDAVDQGIDVARDSGDVASEGALELLSAWYAVERGQYTQALQVLRGVEDLVPRMQQFWIADAEVLVPLVAGTAQAHAGNLEAARALLQKQREAMDNPGPEWVWWHRSLEGEIALAAGDLTAAEAAFLAGEPAIKMPFSFGADPGIIGTHGMNVLPFHDGLARVKKARGDLEGAIAIYRDLLTPDIGSKWTMWLEPRYVLALARLLDETGDKEGARAEYERFLELWKNADEDLPELAEARAYLAQ
jgi:tetratricopeptide (TPR) repeat protein/tRNA A-37 threonylcarbamoyl transferase component Bud32